ncbi:MAG: TetR/AcrR family transcriptional regulator [Candidatus Izimaplasma sp.]|nr:TetR/AcrR family transcriptional regulator [Candidatus Izimaplasma bacterium]
MPKETFFHLNEAKRNKILEAATKEFTTNPLRKSRVSNIIKAAEIPRGSFYQYFNDLDDLYYYVINNVFNNVYKVGITFCDVTNDIFEFAQISFEYDYNGFVNDMRHRFMLNVFQSISSNEEYILAFNKMRRDYIMRILNRMDLSDIRFKKEDDLIKMYRMIQELKRNVIQRAVVENLSIEDASKEFGWFLEIVKHGLVEVK